MYLCPVKKETDTDFTVKNEIPSFKASRDPKWLIYTTEGRGQDAKAHRLAGGGDMASRRPSKLSSSWHQGVLPGRESTDGNPGVHERSDVRKTAGPPAPDNHL